MALSSLTGHPHSPHSLSHFSKEPVSQAVTATWRSRSGVMANRDLLQYASLNGTSNLPVAMQRPQKTLTGTAP